MLALERPLHRLEERLQAERDVLDPAVDEEAGRAADPAPLAAIYVLADALQVSLAGHFSIEARHVELEALGVAAQVLRLEMALILEEQIVHRPELALPAGGLRGERRLQRVRM